MPPDIPFRERLTCTVREACQVSSWGHNKIFELISEGRLESRKIDGRRLIVVASLLRLLGLEDPPEGSTKVKRGSARAVATPQAPT